MKTKIIVIFVCSLLTATVFPLLKIMESSNGLETSSISSDLPVFPGAEGFGTNTRAAYGGKINPVVYKVTNLNPSGPGSLKKALEASEPRVVVFEVSGYIDLKPDSKDPRYSVFIKNPYLFVAGQTAPSPGITIRGGPIVIETHDVVFQHLRIRPGDLPDGTNYEYRDSIDAHNFFRGNVYNIVFDHLSLSWGTDELSNLWYDTKDVTYQYCIFSEALDSNLHPKGRHSCGLIIGPDSRRTSVHHNLFAHCAERNPTVSSSGNVEIVNNVIYNWRWVGTRLTYYHYEPNVCTDPGPKYCNLIGNYYIPGPNTWDNVAIDISGDKPPSLFYVYDNIGPANHGNGRITGTEPEWNIIWHEGWSESDMKSNTPLFTSNINAQDATANYNTLFNKVGARPTDRDQVDNRIIQEVKERKGNIIKSQKEVGGWPDLEENYRELTIPNNPHSDNDGNGYTNLEEWLRIYATELEAPNNNQPPNTPAKPVGPTIGEAGTQYKYVTNTKDLDGDQIYYWFDWGDGTNSGWKGPYSSEKEAHITHMWMAKGDYIVKVKSKDVYGAESLWSDPLTVGMPISKPYISILLIEFLQNHPPMLKLFQRIVDS